MSCCPISQPTESGEVAAGDGETGRGWNLFNWLCSCREPAVELHPPSGLGVLSGAQAEGIAVPGPLTMVAGCSGTLVLVVGG